MSHLCTWFLAVFMSTEGVTARADTLISPPDTTTVVGTYAVAVEYPNIFFWLGAKLLGKEPDFLLCEERRWGGDSAARGGFSITLTADGSDIWLHVTSDTTDSSFTHLPDEPAFPLGKDAVTFIGTLLDFIADSSGERLEGTFTQGSALLKATIARRTYLPGNGEFPRLSASNERCLAVSTENAHRENAPYVTGTLTVGRVNSRLTYPFAEVHLSSADVTMRLFLQQVTVVK